MLPPTIRELWMGFNQEALPEATTAAQRRQLRVAFYAGAGALMATLRLLCERGLSDDDGAAVVNAWLAECDSFIRQQ